eukprot:10022976-Lingulodinium_polyedra.AAC.1
MSPSPVRITTAVARLQVHVTIAASGIAQFQLLWQLRNKKRVHPDIQYHPGGMHLCVSCVSGLQEADPDGLLGT